MDLPDRESVAIGALGAIDLPKGVYLYFGSAFGPGGLRARMGRHLREEKVCRWHVDYLRPHVRMREIWYQTMARRECQWARHALLMHGADSVCSFGASDCGCPAHLVRFKALPRSLARELQFSQPDG